MLVKLALKSLHARKVTVGLTVVSITISIFVLLAIHHIRNETKSNFTNTVSGVDLIVGARTGSLNLLLYSIFRIGNSTNNISWENYQFLKNQKEIAWTIPISLGDSHKGYRVLGTTESYFKHYTYNKKIPLNFKLGKPFASTYEAVIGAAVASKLGYSVNDNIILAHGIGSTSFSKHEDKPFTITGVLESTGTPIDQTIHVRLDGIESIHLGWQSGVDLSKYSGTNSELNQKLVPKSITAFLVGLNSKLSTFSYQRKVNSFENEALMAILPGVALAELWQTMRVIETTLVVISWMILCAALTGMSTMMLATINERKDEIVVLRAVGASPWFILALIQIEAIVIVFFSIVLSCVFLWIGLVLSQAFLVSKFGLMITHNFLNIESIYSIILIFVAAVIVGVFPAFAAYYSNKKELGSN